MADCKLCEINDIKSDCLTTNFVGQYYVSNGESSHMERMRVPIEIKYCPVCGNKL